MKRHILYLLMAIITIPSYASILDRSIEIENPLLKKEVCWEKTKMWVVTAMDTFNAYIAYEDFNTGKIIVKGEYKDTENTLMAVKNDFIKANVSYELEITCNDGFYSAKYNKIMYDCQTSYGDYSLSSFMLEWVKQELETIMDITIEKGNVWTVDSYFDSKYNETNANVEEAKLKMEDPTLKKKERKKYKRYYEANRHKPSVYFYVKHAAHNLVYKSLFNGGLEHTIEQTINDNNTK